MRPLQPSLEWIRTHRAVRPTRLRIQRVSKTRLSKSPGPTFLQFCYTLSFKRNKMCRTKHCSITYIVEPILRSRVTTPALQKFTTQQIAYPVFGIKIIFLTLKHSSLINRWRCSCKSKDSLLVIQHNMNLLGIIQYLQYLLRML
jgi:hypothetical protein